MSESVSPLAGCRSEDRLIGIEDTGLRGMITVRGELVAPAFAAAVGDVLGVSVPERCTFRFDGACGIVWMSPDELLILTDYAEAQATATALSEALKGQHHLVLNVSDARAILRLSGTAVAEILGKGVPVDLNEEAFPIGTARRTHLGSVAVALWRLDDGWEIACFRSFAHHLYAWLIASSEPGSGVDFY